MPYRVYIETSVWGMLPPGQNPALRGPTLEFFQLCERGVFAPHISEIVAAEVRVVPAEMRQHLLAKLAKVAPAELPMPVEAGIAGRELHRPRNSACSPPR
ncbi:MAG TPA: hypothetical protein VGM03_21840 [Phycisphaerae bacterium]|jgi:hypothetical protein